MSVNVEKNKVFVSIDLCRDYSQMAYCFTDRMTEPESVSTIVGEQKYLIPTIVGHINNTKDWCIGDDAILRKKRGEAELSEDILMAVLAEKNIEINGNEYSGLEVLKAYFDGLFQILDTNYHIRKPDFIVVTVEYPDRILVNVIRKILEDTGISKEAIKVIGHSESLTYYTVFQKKELWVNDILVFDFTDKQFLVRRLSVVRGRLPQPIIVEEMDLSSKYTMDRTRTEAEKNEMDEQFLLLLKELCKKHIVSTVYLTGVGFYEKWMKDSIYYLCSKRRVFQGYNLFVKGACYAAVSESGIGNAKDYQFVCSGRTLVNIELEVEKGEKTMQIPLSNAGINWYEAGARAEGILDGIREIRLKVTSSISKNSQFITINLDKFPLRPDKTTRIEIVVSYRTDRQCIIQVKDLGFGVFFQSSGEMVKKIINIEDYL